MKRVWIAIVILAACAGICIASYSGVSATSNDMKDTVKNIVTAVNKKNTAEIEKNKNVLKNQWDKTRTLYSCVLTHSHFDDTSQSINNILQSDNKDEKKLLEDCDSVIYSLDHLVDSEKANLRNIF